MKRYLYLITIALAGLFVSACNNTEKPLDEAEHYIDFGSDESLKNDLVKIYDEYISNYSNRK